MTDQELIALLLKALPHLREARDSYEMHFGPALVTPGTEYRKQAKECHALIEQIEALESGQ